MRKRDSIEFLWDELKPFLPANYTVDESVNILSILKQAKAMHRVEIIESYASGSNDRLRNTINTNYYNKTFGE